MNMKRLLSTALAVALLLGLGALAVLARGGGDILAPADNVVVAAPQPQTAAAPDAPTAISKWNSLAVPLQVPNINTSDKVANYITTGNPNTPGNGITRVMKWNGLRWLEYYPQTPFLGDDDFPVNTGDSLLVLADQNLTATTVSWVGDVPAVGAVRNILAPNAWNSIIIPLDQFATYGSPGAPSGTAATLASAITNVDRVMKWDNTVQRWFEYYPDAPFLGDDDFSVFAGYPYMIHTKVSPPTQWP